MWRLAAPGTVTICASAPMRAECILVQAGRVVIAELADVAGAQAPGLAGHNGCGYLSAGLRRPLAIVDLGAGLGKSLERNQSIRGVQADADNINEIILGQLIHRIIVMGRRKRPSALRI